MEKLDDIIGMKDRIPESDRTSLTIPAQNFAYKTVLPITHCLLSHFDGNKQRFLDHWVNDRGVFPYSKFRDKCKSSCTE
jgi:hypothetical protein